MMKRGIAVSALVLLVVTCLMMSGCASPADPSSVPLETRDTITDDTTPITGDTIDTEATELETGPTDVVNGTGATDKKTDNTAQTKQPTKATSKPTGVLEQVDEYATDGLPNTDLKKFVLKIGTSDKTLIKNLLKEDEDGYEVSDIIKMRYKVLADIEKRFNCTIQPVYFEYGKAAEVYSALILSGASAAVPHVILASTWESGGIMAGNLLTSYDQLQYVDGSKPWWNTSMANSSKVKGKTYLMSSEFVRTTARGWNLVYNKKIGKDVGLTESVLTNLVNNNQWTWDKFIEYAKKAVKDTSGDGKLDDKDRWGFSAPRTDFIYAMMASADANFITQQGGKWAYGLNNDKAITALERLNKIITAEGIRYPVENNTAQLEAYGEGKTLFFAYQTGSLLNRIREQGDTGLLPMPLGPGQTKYASLIDHNSPSILIPKTNKNLKETSLILEALAFANWKLLPDIAQEYADMYFDEGDKLSVSVFRSMFDRMQITTAQFNNTEAFQASCRMPILNAMSTPNEDISGVVASIKNSSQAAIDAFYGQ